MIGNDGAMVDSFQSRSVRAEAVDRSLVAQRLVAHCQAGQLPRGELDQRLVGVARAETTDDLHRLTIDLPDVPGPPLPVTLVAPTPTPPKAPASPLGVAFDVIVLLLTVCAAVCLTLLLIVAGVSSSGGSSAATFFFAALAAFGAFTVGAGGVHLLHRAFGKK